MPSPIAALSDRLELLQRQILRTNTLTTLEREMMLGTLAAARRDLENLGRQLQGQTQDRNQSQGGNGAGWSRG
jgi:hypothetical protein